MLELPSELWTQCLQLWKTVVNLHLKSYSECSHEGVLPPPSISPGLSTFLPTTIFFGIVLYIRRSGHSVVINIFFLVGRQSMHIHGLSCYLPCYPSFVVLFCDNWHCPWIFEIEQPHMSVFVCQSYSLSMNSHSLIWCLVHFSRRLSRACQDYW